MVILGRFPRQVQKPHGVLSVCRAMIAMMVWVAVSGVTWAETPPVVEPKAPDQSPGIQGQPASGENTMEPVNTPRPSTVRQSLSDYKKAEIEREVWLFLKFVTPKHDFVPTDKISRASMAAVTNQWFQLAKRKAVPLDVTMPMDIPQGHWAMGDIETVLKTGVMSGYKPGKFYPNQSVSRAEGVAILTQADGVYPMESGEVEAWVGRFSDSAKIPQWTRKAIATAMVEEFISDPAKSQGSKSVKPEFKPETAMTWDDVAQWLIRHKTRAVAQDQHPQGDQKN